MSWTLENSAAFIQNLSLIAKGYGLGVALGGSVLTEGKSENDLDIILFNLKSNNLINHKELIDFFIKKGLKLKGCPDHSQYGDDKLIYVFFDNQKRKIDLFFVNLKFSDRIEGTKALVRKVPKENWKEFNI